MKATQLQLLLSLCLIFFTIHCFADIESAKEMIQRGEYEAASKELISLSEAGKIDAQCELAKNFSFIPKYRPIVAKWVKVAFDSGKANIECQMVWADYLSRGLGGTIKDLNTTVKIYELGVEQGNATAEYSLGQLYLSGTGVSANPEKGFSLIKSAAEKGERSAFSRLAELYMGKNDLFQAIVWFKKAIEKYPDPNNLYMLAVIYETGWIENGKYINDAAKAVDTYKLAIDTANKDPYFYEYPAFAPYRLALLYASGRLGTKDEKQIFSLYKIAAEKDVTYAMTELSDCYREGKGVEANEIQSVYWSRKAAEMNFPMGQVQLGIAYYWGNFGGITRDYVEAAKWFEKASTSTTGYLPDRYAIYMMGTMYEDGLGVSRNYNKAVELYKKASESGLPMAQNKLGAKYAEGIGIKKDMIEALKWFTIATANGDEKAKENRDKAEKALSKVSVKKAQSLATIWLNNRSKQ